MNTSGKAGSARIAVIRFALAVVMITAVVLASLAFPAAQPGIRRVDLQRHDLSAANREVIQVRVEFDAGAAFGKHHHPGEEVVYVLAGTLEYSLAGRTVTLNAGDVLFIPTGAVHAARNVGTTQGAELATYIVEREKPLVTMDE